MKTKMLKRISIVFLIPIFIGACAQSATSTSTGDTSAEAGSGPVLTVSMTEFKFTPNTYSVPAGSQVTLQLSNDGRANHNWVLMEFGYTAEAPFNSEDETHELFAFVLKPGENDTFTFTAPSEPGDYQVVCSFPGHLAQGMKGTLTVTAADGG
jgi:uncharacterized cupredoxin-like copper-binding protein